MPFVERDGVKLYWETHGEGEPLLLIMGLGYSSEMWYPLLPLLSERYHVVLFDNRGVGRSDVPPGPYPVPVMAEDAAAVMDAAGVEQAHVFGVSMGGMIAQELALREPSRVRSLLLGCTACGGPKATLAAPEVLTTLMARATMSPEEGAWSMVPYLYDAGTPRERIEADIAVRMRTYPSTQGYLAQLQGVGMWESYSRLDTLAVPTLVLHGETDQLVPAANATLLAERIPGAKLVLLPNASHIFFTDQTEAARAALLAFLESVSGPAPAA